MSHSDDRPSRHLAVINPLDPQASEAALVSDPTDESIVGRALGGSLAANNAVDGDTEGELIASASMFALVVTVTGIGIGLLGAVCLLVGMYNVKYASVVGMMIIAGGETIGFVGFAVLLAVQAIGLVAGWLRPQP